jgi:hypothetical protein
MGDGRGRKKWRRRRWRRSKRRKSKSRNQIDNKNHNNMMIMVTHSNKVYPQPKNNSKEAKTTNPTIVKTPFPLLTLPSTIYNNNP